MTRNFFLKKISTVDIALDPNFFNAFQRDYYYVLRAPPNTPNYVFASHKQNLGKREMIIIMKGEKN